VNVSAASTSGSVTGLTNGSTYAVTLRAVNKQGASGSQSVSVTLAGAPGAPVDVRVVASPAAVTVRWGRPVSSGGSLITGYSVCAGVSCVSVGAGDRVGVVPGLVNGQSYAVVVYALSAYGTSVGGSGGSSTPFTSPSAVSISSIEGTDRAITVGWAAGFNGGSVLTGHEVCAVPASGRTVCVDADASAVSAVVPGLVNGVEYTVSVLARNAAGAGLEATMRATPSTVPTIPRIVAQRESGVILLTWDAPRSDGGADVTGYSVCLDASCLIVDPAIRSHQFGGLTNGVRYTVSVQAINSNGPSLAAFRRLTPRLGLDSFLVG
jgi:titin